MSFPFDHRASVNPTWGAGLWLQKSDVIIVLDCDVPWIPTQRKPRADAKIFHIDVDPLKAQMSLFYIAAIARYRADSCAALAQLCEHITSDRTLVSRLEDPIYSERWAALGKTHDMNLEASAAKATIPQGGADAPVNIAYLSARIRECLPKDTIYATEAVTNHIRMMEQLQPSLPGTSFTKGAGGLGWCCGAALGMKLAKPEAFVCSITGDGSFIFSQPTAVYWISAHYSLPILTIVLNNGGWVAPRVSAKHVNPEGLAQQATAEELGIGFGDLPPDYGAVAEAAGRGRIWKARIEKVGQVDEILQQAVESVKKGSGAVLDVLIP